MSCFDHRAPESIFSWRFPNFLSSNHTINEALSTGEKVGEYTAYILRFFEKMLLL
jgi:hypothetical protein